MRLSQSLLLYAAGAAALFAQQGSLSGPVTGYVFDSQLQALRSIRGLPGASLIGDPVLLTNSITGAWVSPKSDSVLVVNVDNTAHLYQLDSGNALEVAADGMFAPERVVFSPSGTAMALVSPGSIRIYKGLPAAPTVTGSLELPVDKAVPDAAAHNKVRRPDFGPVAVSDDGMYALYVHGTAVELLGVAGDSRKLADAARGALPVFVPGAHDAAVVDEQNLALFQNVAGAATVRRFPGIASVKGASFSADGKRLFLAGASVASIDVSSGDRSDVACNCKPAGLTRMGTAFRLTDLGTGPLWLLDASSDPKTVFVPAIR